VVTLTSPAAYYALSSSLGPNQDSQWKSGAAVVFASLVLMNIITVYRSIGSEDSKWNEKYYLSIQNFFENIRKVIPMAALGIGWVTAAIGTILLFVQSHNNQNLATDNYLFATMMFVPTLNWIGYLINAPLLHFTAVGLYYMAVGPYLAGGTTISGGSWQIDYLIAWIGAVRHGAYSLAHLPTHSPTCLLAQYDPIHSYRPFHSLEISRPTRSSPLPVSAWSSRCSVIRHSCCRASPRF